MSAWHINDANKYKLLEDYVKAIYSFKQSGLDIIDYSAISEETLNSTNTYDGHHYLPKINSLIVQDLNRLLVNEKLLEDNFGLDVNDYSFEEYLDDYKSKINKFF